MNKKEKLDKINELKVQTSKKINEFPVNTNTIKDIVLESWNEIFTITNSNKSFVIGENIFPKPQLMGFFLEVLIGKKFEKINKSFKFDPTGYSKDITNISNDDFSIEIKTSSSEKNIYGNRSYAKKTSKKSKKNKDSFYIAINFEKFNSKNLSKKPKISLIRFGYLTHEDWKAQAASTGQQSSIPAINRDGKLLEIWPIKDNILK